MNSNKTYSKGEIFNWHVLLIISLSSLAIGVYRDGFGVLLPFIEKEFVLTKAQLGLHSTMFFFANMVMGLFSGRLIDLKGSKWGFLMGASLTGMIIILHSIAPNYLTLIIFGLFTGFFVSLNMPAANVGLSYWFPDQWKGTAIGIMSTAFPIGGMLAALLLPVSSVLFGWRTTIIFPGLFCLLCGIIIFFNYQEKNKKDDIQKVQKTNQTSFKIVFLQLYKNKDLMTMLPLGFILGATTGSIATHFTLFLYSDYGFSENIAGFGFAAVQLGSIIGRPIWGLISDRFLGGNRKIAFLYMGLMFFPLSIIMSSILKLFVPSIIYILLIAFFVGISGRSWQGLYFTSIVETVRLEAVGISIGLSLIGVRAGLMLAPPIFGYIADLRGSYDYSWLFLGLIFLFSTIIFYYFSTKIIENN